MDDRTIFLCNRSQEITDVDNIYFCVRDEKEQRNKQHNEEGHFDEPLNTAFIVLFFHSLSNSFLTSRVTIRPDSLFTINPSGPGQGNRGC